MQNNFRRSEHSNVLFAQPGLYCSWEVRCWTWPCSYNAFWQVSPQSMQGSRRESVKKAFGRAIVFHDRCVQTCMSLCMRILQVCERAATNNLNTLGMRTYFGLRSVHTSYVLGCTFMCRLCLMIQCERLCWRAPLKCAATDLKRCGPNSGQIHDVSPPT